MRNIGYFQLFRHRYLGEHKYKGHCCDFKKIACLGLGKSEAADCVASEARPSKDP